jgi:hypothetical protein
MDGFETVPDGAPTPILVRFFQSVIVVTPLCIPSDGALLLKPLHGYQSERFD